MFVNIHFYFKDASEIDQEFYLSCLVDRASSKIAFISSAEGGMDIEEVASKTPEKIITTRLNIDEKVKNDDVFNILKPYNLKDSALGDGKKIIQALYKALIKTDANLIEVNPLITTKDNKVICLDAKINFDDNALFRHPEILEYRDKKIKA